MIRDTFKAGVQYGDWNGTAAADEFGDASDDFDELFESTGKVDKEKDILIGFNFYEIEGNSEARTGCRRLPQYKDAYAESLT